MEAPARSLPLGQSTQPTQSTSPLAATLRGASAAEAAAGSDEVHAAAGATAGAAAGAVAGGAASAAADGSVLGSCGAVTAVAGVGEAAAGALGRRTCILMWLPATGLLGVLGAVAAGVEATGAGALGRRTCRMLM